MDAQALQHRRETFARMMRAKRIAIIGASERNAFASRAVRNLDTFKFGGEVFLVNAKGEPVAGRPTLRSARELPEGVDAAFVCVPLSSVFDVVQECADAGVKGFVVVSSGFAETGPEGAQLQKRLRQLAVDKGAMLIGPNGLGFVNYIDRIALCVIESDPLPGSFGLASVSGSVGGYITSVCRLHGVGLSHMILTGNEADVTITDALEFLVDDPHTKSIGMFVEAIHDRDADRFARAAERALRARKPIVVLKAGASPNTAHLAAAHTGALVGDDKVFNAVVRDLGISRVHSYEELVTTATLLEKCGPIAKPGVAAITVSGGSGEILSDLAEQEGVSFPPYVPAVKKEMETFVSEFGHANNPLDLTGAAMRDPLLWEKSLTAIAKDDNIGLVLCIWEAVAATHEPWIMETFRAIVRGYKAFPVVPPLMNAVMGSITPEGRKSIHDMGLPGMIFGLKSTAMALGHLRRWSVRALDPRGSALFTAADSATLAPSQRPDGERALLDWLGARGAAVTPGTLAHTQDDAVRAAAKIGYPVALKLAAPEVLHKSEVGGVKLNLADEPAVRAAFDQIMAAKVGKARIDGVIVSPMRQNALELLVSVVRDPTWGPMLTLGLGGIWVETLKDVAMLPLPVDRARVIAALESLKAAPLFKGARGKPPVNVARVADAVVALARAALAMGPTLRALEINPLAVTRDGVEAMDALALWTD